MAQIVDWVGRIAFFRYVTHAALCLLASIDVTVSPLAGVDFSVASLAGTDFSLFFYWLTPFVFLSLLSGFLVSVSVLANADMSVSLSAVMFLQNNANSPLSLN